MNFITRSGGKKKDFLMVARDLPQLIGGVHQQQLVWLQILGVRGISAPQYIFLKGKETIKFPTPYKIALLFLGFSQNALKSKERGARQNGVCQSRNNIGSKPYNIHTRVHPQWGSLAEVPFVL
jgi:hypothetical protein